MMARTGIAKGRNAADPQWIFRWRGSDGSTLPRLFSIAIAGGGFAFLLAFVKVQIGAPQQWIEQKASVIHMKADADGRAWAIRAEEGGPFPSRFDPAMWTGYAALKHQVIAATRISRPVYVPQLRDLPVEKSVAPVLLAAKNEPVYPNRSTPKNPSVEPKAFKLSPILYPLSKIPLEAMPQELPVFDAAIDAEMSSAAWRFLLRLHPDGGVADCTSLAGATSTGSAALENWLRKIRFDPVIARTNPWISIAVGFTNQPQDGTDAR